MSQRFKAEKPQRKRDLKVLDKQQLLQVKPQRDRKGSEDKQPHPSSTKKRRWIEEFTQNNNNHLKRRRIFVDLIELQRYDGLALCSNHVLNFKIVSCESEINSDPDTFFNPKFSHQIFHKDETVRGYKDLSIELFLTPATLRPYVNVEFSKMADNHDDIIGTLKTHFGDEALVTSQKEFVKILNEERTKFKPFGKKVGQFTREIPLVDNSKPTKRKVSNAKPKTDTKYFDIYKVEANNEKFNKINRRLQALIMFYIDGASFIALDGNWWYFLVYCDNKVIQTFDLFQLVAFATAYEQKKPYLGKSRSLKNSESKKGNLTKILSKYTYKLRISQFLVLPPYQRLGIGSTLLESMYSHYIEDKKCTEITVEDPSEDFQQMKDALDIKLIWKNGFFTSFRDLFKGKKSHKSATINKHNIDDLVLDQQEILDIQGVLKLKKQNILRCFELIILSKLDPKDPLAHQKFAQEVKRKFYYQMNKNLLQPYFQLESFYGSILPQTQPCLDDGHHLGPSKLVHKSCCNGDGKIIPDEHVKQFESSFNKFHHHYHGPNIPGIIEYQRVYNKYTPTPLATTGTSNGILYNQNAGKQMGWSHFLGATPRFELPENLQKKILRIISQD